MSAVLEKVPTGGAINAVISTLPEVDDELPPLSARPEAAQLLARLHSHADSAAPILFGHQDSTAYGVHWHHPALDTPELANGVVLPPRFRAERLPLESAAYDARWKLTGRPDVLAPEPLSPRDGTAGALADAAGGDEVAAGTVGDESTVVADVAPVDGRTDGTDGFVWSDVYATCGRMPAVYGWDLGGVDVAGNASSEGAREARNLDGVPFSLIRRLMIEADARGGINTVSFHQHHPISRQGVFVSRVAGHGIDVPVPEAVLSDFPRAFFERLHAVAEFLRSVRRADGHAVPVVLRLFHEHTESWAWWGKAAVSEENFRRLFRATVAYLVRDAGLTNVVFAYAPQDVASVEDYMYGYPGDAFVDVLGLDQYEVWDGYQMDRLSEVLALVTRLAEERGKVAALTETGIDQVQIQSWWSRYLLPALDRNEHTRKIAWVLTWRNASASHFFVPYPDHEAAEDFREFADSALIQFEKRAEDDVQ